jgi:hypothetical protein
MAGHGLVTLYNVKCTQYNVHILFAQKELTVLKFQAGNFFTVLFQLGRPSHILY